MRYKLYFNIVIMLKSFFINKLFKVIQIFVVLVVLFFVSFEFLLKNVSS